jgi:hypothetical protein
MIEFISGSQVWRRITAAAKASNKPAYVAVAYFGKEASRLLPLTRGSRLVVDASEHAVKSGQTHPADLKRLVRKGVRVYTLANLHAKIFVFGSKAFVGSANASRRSSSALIEAIVVTTDKSAVKAVRALIERHCLQPLGPEELDRLQSMYRPPHLPPESRRVGPRARRRGTAPTLRPLRLVQLWHHDPPEGSEAAAKAGRAAARREMTRPRAHDLDEFHWDWACPFQRGDVVVQIVNEGGGRRMVSPPGNVINVTKWARGNGRRTFVYLELPRRPRTELKRLARRIGRGAQKRLLRGGKASADFAHDVLVAFAPEHRGSVQ